MYAVFLALRYLLTRPINLLGMIGIAISVWALVVVSSLFTGFIAVVEQHVQEASADISVTQLPPWADWQKLAATLADDPNVAGTAPRLLHFGILQRPGELPPPAPLPGRGALHGGDQPFLFVYGVDAAREVAVSGFGDWLANPAIPPADRVADARQPFAVPGDRPGILLSTERLAHLHLHRGDRVLMSTARIEGQGQSRAYDQATVEFTVAGAFKSRHGGFDGNVVFVAIDALRAELLPELPADSVHEIAVKVKDEASLDATRDRLQAAVGRALDRGELRSFGRVETWRQRNASFLFSVQHQRVLLRIVLFVILLVAAFLMLATLSMMVTEKTSDIGILTAMGGTPVGVTSVFFACGLAITALGVLLGIGTGVVTAVYLEEIRQAVLAVTGKDLFPLDVYNLDRVPCAIEPMWLLLVALAAFLIGLVAAVIPALRAAFHDPLVSLRGA